MTFSYLSLQSFVRPPRLLVLAPEGEDWVAMSAAALGAVGKVWGGCASAVVPVSAASHAALAPFLARYQPDHILEYQLTWTTADLIHPGILERELRGLDLDEQSFSFNKELLAADTWDGHADGAALQAAAERLRAAHGVNSFDRSQPWLFHLADDPGKSGFTALRDVTPQPTGGVPIGQIRTPAALSAAARLGVLLAAAGDEAQAPKSEADWLTQVARTPWNSDDPASPFDAAAALCARIHRGYNADRSSDLVVLGDRPEDFALAQLARQVYGATRWLPGSALAWHHLPLSRRPEPITVVSASLSEEEIHAHLTDRWITRGIRVHGADTMPVTIVSPGQLRPTGRDQVALLNAWDMPLSLPVEETSDGSLVSAVRMPVQVPAPLDAARHRWQVGMISTSHPVPPLSDLSGPSLVAAGDERETFVRAADGGITYASNRVDFVPAGASLAGSLAGPRLVWPSLERILRLTAEPDEIRPSPAGKRARVAKRLLGSRTAVEALAAPAPWALLSHWLPGHDRSALPADSAWELKSGAFLTWEAIAAASGNWAQAELRAQIDAWSTCGLLRRGLVLGCHDCPRVEFYPIAEVAQQYTCRRCGSSNTLEQPRWKPIRNEPTWFYELHPAITELIANDGNYDLLATQFLRSKAWAGACLVTEEFELVQNGKAVVEFDFAAATVEGLFLGESKKNDCLAATAKATLTELNKLLNGCRTLGATHLVLATPKDTWKQATVDAIDKQLQGDTAQGVSSPQVLLLTCLGTNPKITTLDGAPFTMD
ncbi:hypothetical protein [Kitasatospora paranensis]|uniref:Uncharacterized protein n=2 Tax=Kitasatospora paranensis TaxID=258053 RepID=A0ABW2FZW3_9ACTN